MELLRSSIVIKGDGFTPQVVNERAFRQVFPDPPSQVLALPPVAIIEYPSGHRVMVQEERVEVSRERPPAAEDELIQRAVAEVPKLWPLVAPAAVGINFIAAQYYVGDMRPEAVRESFLHTHEIEALFGSHLTSVLISLTFPLDAARVTVKVAPDGRIDGRAAIVLDLNAHYEPVTDIGPIVRTQQQWHERLLEWGRRLENGGAGVLPRQAR